jgi:hypothetical protein
MVKDRKLSRRHLLNLLSGGSSAATLTAIGSAGAGLGAMPTTVPNPLDAAQSATLRRLPRLKITDVKVFRTQVNNTHMCNVKVLTSEPGLYGVGDSRGEHPNLY